MYALKPISTIWINDSQREYIIEVDLLYDFILHDRDDNFPMAPENIDIRLSMLSSKQHQLQIKYYRATYSTKHKLICSFLPKTHYVIYSPLLLFYMERRLKVTKVYRAIQFNASQILKCTLTIMQNNDVYLKLIKRKKICTNL